MSERMRDRDIAPAVTAAAGIVIPDRDRWTVVTGADGAPGAAIPPGGGPVLTNLFSVDVETPVAAVVGSRALSSAPADTVVVVTRGNAPIGVWSGDDFVDAFVHGSVRGGSGALPGDIVLPGRISKQDITRHCRYAVGGRACAVILVVPEKPDPMPSCPAQPGIAAHPFAW
jgi:hypothetical protein